MIRPHFPCCMVLSLLFGGFALRPADATDRPNIIIILADDMGFSDIGCYGGEIRTPVLDRLAANGLRLTQFYNTGRCCPTRAALLTGLYSHQSGVGHMTGDDGEEFPGYRGRLNRQCVTIAEVLAEAGYFTAMSGKWHVGSKEQAWWPRERGFHRFYGVPQGGGFYFQPKQGRDIVLDDEILHPGGEPVPDDWYVTDAFTDYGLTFIDEAVDEQQPFFLYVAHIAPHFPLEAPAEEIARYDGVYEDGWAPLREARHRRQLEMGLLKQRWPLSEDDRGKRSWQELENRARQARGMETYAAIVERLDRNIGRIVDHLTQREILDNTLLVFLSDNGGCAEGGTYVTSKDGVPLGAFGSDVKYGKAWANASNTPFRMYKHYVHEGGIASPFVVHWPLVIPERLNGTFCHEPGHVVDLMATCIDVAQASYPESYRGHDLVPLAGRSLVALFQGETRPDRPLFWEHEGNRAVRSGDWKLVAKGRKGAWELYNLASDRTELNNLADSQPDKVRELATLWEDWAQQTHVVPHPKGAFGPSAD